MRRIYSEIAAFVRDVAKKVAPDIYYLLLGSAVAIVVQLVFGRWFDPLDKDRNALQFLVAFVTLFLAVEVALFSIRRRTRATRAHVEAAVLLWFLSAPLCLLLLVTLAAPSPPPTPETSKSDAAELREAERETARKIMTEIYKKRASSKSGQNKAPLDGPEPSNSAP